MLIVACPCAMGLAVPTSIMVGTGRAAELGTLFRRGEVLQRLATVDVVAFDKTGTLTQGRPELVAIAGDSTALRDAAALEARSEHPIAAAILAAAQARGIAPPPAEGFLAIAGFGATATVDGRGVAVGSAKLLARQGIDPGALGVQAAEWAAQGWSPVFVAVDGVAVAALAIADPVKPTSAEALAALRAQGLSLAMVTGDDARTARHVAAELGLDDVAAEVAPDGKVAAVERLRAGGKSLAFVGDGINDAPALAAAEVGIAIGTGTDVAIESADVVLTGGDPRGVARAVAVARATLANIRQNLAWAFGYNIALIPLAAGVLVPFGGPALSPVMAGAAMALSSVSVVGNALRLRRAGA